MSRPGFAATLKRNIRTPEQLKQAEYALEDISKRKLRNGYRSNGGCYECCQGVGSRRELWDRLCTVCHKTTRGQSCCGYYTVTINPRIRVPRIDSNRWKHFLKKFPHFEFSEKNKVSVGMTIHELLVRGLWNKACEIKNLNPYLLDEDTMTCEEEFFFTIDEINQLGLTIKEAREYIEYEYEKEKQK